MKQFISKSRLQPALSLRKAIYAGAIAFLALATEASTLYEAHYQYDKRGLVTNLLERYEDAFGESRELQYDALGRLTQEKWGAYQVHYAYDHLDNRLQQTHSSQPQVSFSYNIRNELEQYEVVSGPTFELRYDPNGSLTQKVAGVVTTSYEWDSRGRMTSVRTNDTEIFRASYAGGLSRREKVEGTTSKIYRHDGATTIQEVDATGKVKELVRGDRGAATIGGILYQADTLGTNRYYSYYTYNGVGSTVVLSGDDAMARKVKYDSFGNILEADEGVDIERLANTKELDSSTGLYFHGARYYDAQLGRYISADPARDGINFYVYANNAPLNFVDPTGLSSEEAGIWDTYFAPTWNAYIYALDKTIVEPLATVDRFMIYLAEMHKVPYAVGGGPLGTISAGATVATSSKMAVRTVSAGSKVAAGARGLSRVAKPGLASRALDDLPPIARSVASGQRSGSDVIKAPYAYEIDLKASDLLRDRMIGLLERDKTELSGHILAKLKTGEIDVSVHPFERYHWKGYVDWANDPGVVHVNAAALKQDGQLSNSMFLTAYHECIHCLQHFESSSISRGRGELAAVFRTWRWARGHDIPVPGMARNDQMGKALGIKKYHILRERVGHESMYGLGKDSTDTPFLKVVIDVEPFTDIE